MPRWKVVGGADKGGILVREGCDLSSPKCAERLSTGALVTQIALLEERLHYKLIEGSGPTEGWVSLKISGKDLLVPAAVDPSERRRLAAAAAEARAGPESPGIGRVKTVPTLSADPASAASTPAEQALSEKVPTESPQPRGDSADDSVLNRDDCESAAVATRDDCQSSADTALPAPAEPPLPAAPEEEPEAHLDELLQKIYGIGRELVEDAKLAGLDKKPGLDQDVVEMNMEDVFEEVGEVVQAQARAKASPKSLPAKTLPPVSGSLLRVRLLDGKTVVSVAIRNHEAPVHLLQDWLHKRQMKEATHAGWTPELTTEVRKGDWAIMNRSAFPPKELADESKTLAEEDLSQGGQLSLVRAAGRGEVRQASHRETLLWRGYHGMGGKDWQTVRENAHKRYNKQEAPVTPWRLVLGPGEEGIVKGALVGKYTIFDHTGHKHKFQKAGMMIICHAPSAEAAKECHELALQLNFLVFSFPLLTYGMPAEEQLSAEALVIHKVFEWFQQQTSLMVIQAVVGVGLSCTSAIIEYAGYFQREAHRVALLLGPGDIASRIACTWPDQDQLSENQKVFIVYKEDHQLHHTIESILAVLPSKILVERKIAGSSLARLWPSQATAALNDCLEGARRLDEGYSTIATGSGK